MVGGYKKWLEARVDGLEKVIDRHLQWCEELGRSNTARIDELLKASNANAAACISTATQVRDDMQKAFIKYMIRFVGGSAIVIIGAVEALLRLR